MRSMIKLGISGVFLWLTQFVFMVPALAFYTNMPASVVIGQMTFVGNLYNQCNCSTGIPNGLIDVSSAFVHEGKLIVSDRSSSRVLIYNKIPTENNASADVVVGQQNFVVTSANQGGTRSARTLNVVNNAIVAEGKLIVTDQSNNRVLIWNTVPNTNNAPADVVIGQTDFSTATSNQGGRGANTIFTPIGVSYHKGKLFVTDSSNHRVLIFNRIPTTNKPSADVVIGQPSFTVGSSNQGGSVAANTLSVPTGVEVINDKLFIADQSNNRVLIFNSIPTSNNANADVVLGQATFTTNSVNQGGTAAANTLNSPKNVYYDGKRFYILDGSNFRLLIYNSIPTSNNASADVVIGQRDLNSKLSNQGTGTNANTLSSLGYSMARYDNKLILPDLTNRRILIYEDTISTPVLGFGGFENLPEGGLRAKGNVLLGERGKYTLQYVYASLNGQGEKLATSIGAGTEEGIDKTKYEFYTDYFPWIDSGVDKDKWNEDKIGYTLKLRAISYNTDESSIFLFKPFILSSFSSTTGLSKVSFFVGEKHIDRIKDNVDHFEVLVREVIKTSKAASKDSVVTYGDWTKYMNNIPVSLIDSKGVVTFESPNTLTTGDWEVRVVAISKSSNFAYESNTVTASVSSVSKSTPQSGVLSKDWFPLQIDSITGVNSGIISTTNPSLIKSMYKTTTLHPTISGTAFSGSTVTVTVTDVLSGKHVSYKTLVSNSRFSLSVLLFPVSTIDVSVKDSHGRFNRLVGFGVSFSK